MNKNVFLSRLIFACLFVLGTGQAWSQACKVSASLDTSAALIGKDVVYTLKVENTAGKRLVLPTLADSLVSGVERVKLLAQDTQNTPASQIITQRFSVMSFDSGSYRIPAGPVIVVGAGSNDTLWGEPVSFEVGTIAVDTVQPYRGLAPVQDAQFKTSFLVKVALIGLGILLALAFNIWLIIYIIRKRKTKKAEKEVEAKLPYDQRTQKWLSEALATDFWKIGDQKRFYTQFTDLLRWYIQNRYNINALEHTSDELIQLLQRTDIPTEYLLFMKDLLASADMVKFAKQETDVYLCRSYLERAIAFVEQTKPIILQTQIQGS